MEECRGVQSSVHPGFNRTSGKAEEPAGYSVLSGPHLPTTILTDGPPPLQGGLGTGGTGNTHSPWDGLTGGIADATLGQPLRMPLRIR